MISQEENDALTYAFDTDYLHTLLTSIAVDNKFSGATHVGSVDSWPTLLSRGDSAAMIFNTDYAYAPGEHWIATFIDGPTRLAYFFDSAPSRPFPQNILKKLNSLCDRVENTNPQRYILQYLNLCGLYSISFLLHAIKNEHFQLCYNNRYLNDVDIVHHVLPYISKTFV